MRLLAIAVACCCACKPPSSLELAVAGSFNTGGAEQPLTLSGPWELNSDSFGETSGLTYGPQFLAKSGDFTRVDVRFDSLHEPLALGRGTWSVGLKALAAATGVEAEFLSNDAVTVTRIRDTGQADFPFELVGTLDGAAPFQSQAAGETGSVTLRGQFVWQVRCHFKGSASFFTPSSLLCGETQADFNGTFSSKPTTGTYANVESTCPEAVKAAFLDGTSFDYSVTQLKVGAAKPLACRITGDIQDSESPPIAANRVCTATATVEADGCTWTVDAISNPARRVVLNALASDACARPAGRACQVIAR